MSRTQIVFVVLSALVFAPVSAGADGPLARKPRLDEAKVRVLIEALKSAPDEKTRTVAADQLGRADPRISPDAAPALVNALRKDASAAVRAEAAASLRELGEVFPQAAVALEEAAESDPSRVVRAAAQRTLWVYHLSGYRAAQNSDGFPAQTIEPPVASPSGPQQAAALVPAPPAPVIAPRLPPVAPSVPRLPAVVSQPAPPQPSGLRFWPNVLPGPRTAMRSMFTPAPSPPPQPAQPAPVANSGPPPIPNLTNEPPVAKKLPFTGPPPKPPAPEPAPSPPPVPDFVPTLPPFHPDLPSVVTPPWATPLPVPKLAPPPK